MKRIFVSDCEGPISKNDNACELLSHFVPDGARLFAAISRYDDVLADVLRRSGHKAGDTLKLVLPFLKAHGVTDKKMLAFSAKNVALISDIKDTLQHIRSLASTFIVSTSYEHYTRAVCKALDFPFENTFCTKLSIDPYTVSEREKRRLKEIEREIVHTPQIEIPFGAKTLEDLSPEDRNTIQRLDEIFWKETANMNIGKVLSEINPVGGKEKARKVEDIARLQGTTLADIVYVGDSITDVEAFRLVKDGSGLAVSFNGNQYAIRNAEIAILSESSLPNALVAEVFCRTGKPQVMALVRNWNHKELVNSPADRTMIDLLLRRYPQHLPKVKIITSENTEALARESSDFRKKVRGEVGGGLG